MTSDDLDQTKDRYFFEGTIDRFEDKMAVIIVEDGQKLLWPIKNLPEDSDKGQKVRIILSTSKTDQEDREKTAKTILNKILKTNNENDK